MININLLIQALGKQRFEPEIVAIEQTLSNIMTQEVGELLLLTTSLHDITLLFNEMDHLIKVEFALKSAYGQQFVQQFCQNLPVPITIDNLITCLGNPHTIIHHPQSSLQKKQLLYNKTAFWFSLQCRQNILEIIALLLPSMIPPNIQSNIFPVRTCKNKD